MTLAGKKILVTRPAGQADALCRLITAAGGEPVRFPVIEILPPENTDGPKALLADAGRFAQVIFISRNAVSFALHLVPDLAARLGDRPVLATGAGTRRELLKHGIGNSIDGGEQGDSEALLAMELLQPSAVAAARILIVRGSGGRELLGKELQRRGATVDYAEVYRRALPVIGPAITQALWRDIKPDIAVVTSAEGLHNLIELTNADDRKQLLAIQLVVLGQRVRAGAVSLGFVRDPVVAEHFSDQGLLQALLKTVE